MAKPPLNDFKVKSRDARSVVSFRDEAGQKKSFTVERLRSDLSKIDDILIAFPTHGSDSLELYKVEASRRTDVRLIFRELDGRNAVLPEDRQLEFVKLISQNVPRRTVSITYKPGFREDASAFLMPHYSVGTFREPVRWDTSHDGSFATVKGNMADFSAGVLEPAAQSPSLTFGILLALAAPLMGYLQAKLKTHVILPEAAVFHFAGPSSTGKTTLVRAATAVFGDPNAPQLDYGATNRAIEEQAYERNDLLFVIDDTEKAAEDDEAGILRRVNNVGQIIPKGVSNGRSNSRQHDLPGLTWRGAGMSTGPITTAELAIRAGKLRHGQRVRVFDIPIPPETENGIFGHRIPAGGEPNSRALIERIEATIAAHHGVLFKAWLEALIETDHSAYLEKAFREFVETVASDETGLEQRAAGKFAIIYAAGMLAVQLGLVPWKEKWIRSAVKHCYHSARSLRDPDYLAVRNGIEQTLHVLRGPKNYVDIAKKGAIWNDERIGIHRGISNSRERWVHRESIIGLSSTPEIGRRVFDELLRRGVLKKGSNRTSANPFRLRSEDGSIRKYRLWRVNVKTL